MAIMFLYKKVWKMKQRRLNGRQPKQIITDSVKRGLKEGQTFRFDNTPMGIYNKMARYETLIFDLNNVVKKLKRLSGKSLTTQSNDSIDSKVWNLANNIESLVKEYGLDYNSFNPDDWYPDAHQTRFSESLKESLNTEEGIDILKQASEIYMRMKELEKEYSNLYKNGYIPDERDWYKYRREFLDVMKMDRGTSLHPYTHPLIDSLAEIMYKNGLTVDDVMSLNIPPFNKISVEKG